MVVRGRYRERFGETYAMSFKRVKSELVDCRNRACRPESQ